MGGEEIVDAAFKGTAIGDIDFSKVGWDFRKETIGKGIVYLNVFPYVIWEMQDAINDCKVGKLSENADSVHAWDEAVAFYTGSLEGTTQGGSATGGLSGGVGEGELQFTVAEKRCINFGTCTAGGSEKNIGYSQANFDILKLFTRGRDEILLAVSKGESACYAITETMNEISGLMLVPFIQGVQRYLYKTSVALKAKEAGELFAFASAALPFIDAVDPTAAEMLYNRAWKQDFTTESDFKTIKYAVEGTYSHLGVGAGQGKVTCSAVGELVDNGVTLSQACIDAATTPVNIAGYEPASDVIQHARIDLDVNAIIDDLPGKNSADINDCVNNQCKYDADNMAAPVTAGKASDVWTNGKYSRKS